MRDFFNESAPTRFLFPIDGDCVNDRDGEAIDGGILLPLTVEAPAGHEVTVNALRATADDRIHCVGNIRRKIVLPNAA